MMDSMDIQKHLLEQLLEIKATWHVSATPRGKTRAEIIKWLDTNITASYYWDDTNITNTINKVYLESADDLVFYRMVWEEYL